MSAGRQRTDLREAQRQARQQAMDEANVRQAQHVKVCQSIHRAAQR